MKSWISQFGDFHGDFPLKRASKCYVFWARELHVARKKTGFPVVET